MKRLRLIPNWRQSWRFFGMQAKATATGMLVSWAALPEKWQQVIPVLWVIVAACSTLVLGAIGRLIEQPKVKAKE
jgi:hypothetical protein